MTNPYGDYLAGPPLPAESPWLRDSRPTPPPKRVERHWAHLDDHGLLDAADCVALGGHCWASMGEALPTNPPQWREQCRHCPATRVGRRQPGMAWTYPEGQP